MFDGDVEAKDEFELSVTTSIQKALSALWCSYNFPFRRKFLSFETTPGYNTYETPNGNIVEKTVNGKSVYGVRSGKTYLNYNPDCELSEEQIGAPESFYIKNDEIILYPTPDDIYQIEIEYWTIFAAKNEDNEEKATLEEETDYIDVPTKYEHLFLNALMPLAMLYAIASDSDENTSGYKRQYDEAYKILIDFTRGLDVEKRVCW